MKLLALDTSGPWCSVALHDEGEIHERRIHCPQGHSEWVLVLIQALLSEAGLALAALDGLAFGCGPGSFTGLRIAAGVIQGLGLALEVPIAPVSTLAALALQGFDRCPAVWALPALDARMGEVYWAAYQRDADGFPVPLIPEQVSPLDAILVPEGSAGVKIGSGWGKPLSTSSRWQGLAGDVLADAECWARDVATLGVAMLLKGKGVAPDQALPLYLRNRVTTPPSR
ncbi:tRNA threonylcarbamoyladenosine biosynthesis protein TsaB [Gammaproteobacteria bacterium]